MHIYTQTKSTRKTLDVNKRQNVCACVGVCVFVYTSVYFQGNCGRASDSA